LLCQASYYLTKWSFTMPWPRGYSIFNPEYFLICSFSLFKNSAHLSTLLYWTSKALAIFWDQGTTSLIPFVTKSLGSIIWHCYCPTGAPDWKTLHLLEGH
jgi:hypothetical protein